MAATMTAEQELTYASFPIEKVEHTADGDLLVYGKATDGTVDSDDQIVDPAWSQKALSDWLETGGNVRVQHQAQRDPAGKGVGVEFTPDGHFVKALIVEPVAKRLVEKGVLRAYSVGISRPVIERDITGKARGGLIKGGVLSELSLVDRPANGNCSFQLVKSADDGSAELTGKVFGAEDVLAKAAAPDDQITSTVSFSPADMAKLLTLRAELEKTGDSKPSDDDDGDDDASDSSDSGGGDEPDSKDDTGDVQAEVDEADDDSKAAEPDAVKADLSAGDRDALPASSFAYVDSQGGKHLPVHDEGHVKSALGRFSQTQFEGGKAKRKAAKKILSRAKSMGIDVADDSAVAQAAKKTAKPADAVKAAGEKCGTCNGTGKIMDGHRNCPDCGHDGAVDPGDEGAKTAEADVAKAGSKACTGCGKNYHSDSPANFCEGCGKKLPAADKAAKPTPDDGAMGEDVDPVPAHREPDGPDFEKFEHDAGLPTVPDAPLEVKAARRRAQIGADTGEAVLHDLLCPAFSAKVLGETYPWLGDVRDAVDIGHWRQKAIDSAAGAPLAQARAATDMWQHAETLKEFTPADLADVHDGMHKAFQDANPGPGHPLTPGDMQAGRYNRPPVTAGHERLSPGYTVGKPDVAIPSGTPDASQYTRGPVTAGHERPSPSDEAGSNAKVPPPAPAGQIGRTFYTNASRDSARSAMASMHDHIAQTFPDLCPMSSKAAEPAPVPEVEPDVTKAETDEIEKDETSAVTKAAVENTITGPDLTKQIGDLQDQLDKSRRDMTELQAQVEEMAAAPDPRYAPFKGVMSGYPPARQAEPASAVQKAADTAQSTLLDDLNKTWRYDPDPAARENAYAAIRKILGLP